MTVNVNTKLKDKRWGVTHGAFVAGVNLSGLKWATEGREKTQEGNEMIASTVSAK